MLSKGKVFLWKGKPVLITKGKYMGTHGISNFWWWRLIKEDGSLGEEMSGYDNKGEFKPYTKPYQIKVIL